MKLEEMTQEELTFAFNYLASAVKAVMEKGLHIDGPPKFLLLVFNDPATTQYVSSCERADMVKALRAAADRIEKNQDQPR